VLAMILVNEREVVEVARIERPLVEAVQLAEGPAELLELRRGHAVEIDALLDLAVLVLVLVGCPLVNLVSFALDHELGERDVIRADVDAAVLGRASVVDPLGDELNVRFRNGFAAPRQARELRTVKRRISAQPLNQSGARSPSGGFRGRGMMSATRPRLRLFRRDQPDAVEAREQKLVEGQVPRRLL